MSVTNSCLPWFLQTFNNQLNEFIPHQTLANCNFSDAVAHTVYRKPSFLLSASEELKSVEEHQLFVPVTLS